jgi:Protein of unknown function (DUF1698)
MTAAAANDSELKRVIRLSRLIEGVDDSEARRIFGYQPFALPSGARTGVGYSWLTGNPIYSAHPTEVDAKTWVAFSDANDRLNQQYEDIIAGAKETLGSFSGLTYADVACNAGYFCYRFLQEGALSATGYDAFDDLSKAFEIVNANLGTQARFMRQPYDWTTHSIDGVSEIFDIVSSIAFMCHCSDPTYFLSFLGQMTRRCLILYSNVFRDDRFLIEFSRTTSLYFGKKFPVCFDAGTGISDALLTFSLKEMGFQRILELPRAQSWIYPSPPWRCFIAIR